MNGVKEPGLCEFRGVNVFDLAWLLNDFFLYIQFDNIEICSEFNLWYRLIMFPCVKSLR